MYSSVHHCDGKFFVRMKSTGLAAVKGFTHGRISFDPIAKTVQFSHHPPLPLPDFAEMVKKDAVLSFRLLAPDGTARVEHRDIVILERKAGQLFAPGIPRNPSKNSKEDGWRIRVLKFRAYFAHPGVESEHEATSRDGNLPQWLQNSIIRQRRFRNRLVKLCLDARNACCSIHYEDFSRFVREIVLPAMDDFNNSQSRGEDKISVKKLRVETPSIFVLTRFGTYLQHLEREGKPVPLGLAKEISAFTKALKLDFTPINLFQRNLDSIVRHERFLEDLTILKSEDENGQEKLHKVYRRLTDPGEIEARRSELELRDWEWKHVASGFKSALKRRKTLGLHFYEGWPRFSDENSTDWGIHFHLNNGGSDASLLSRKGVRALKLEPSVPPDQSGRKWKANGRRARRELNPVQISFHDSLADEQFIFRFFVLRHQFPIPSGALIKKWMLIHNRSGLWLYFVVEGRYAKPTTKGGATAAVHIGWRREGSELWPAIVFDPTRQDRDAFHRVVVDTELSPEKSEKHTPFRINMGPSRKGRRSPYWISRSKPHLRAEPGAPGTVQIMDTWKGIEWLGHWRNDRRDVFKSLLLNSLIPAPAGLQKAAVGILHKIGQSLTDPILVRAYKMWAAEDKQIGDLTREFSARIVSRLSDGYSRVAHDICHLLSEHGVSTIAIQNSLPFNLGGKRMSSSTVRDREIRENSQTNRQRIAPGKLLIKILAVAETYGVTVIKVPNAFITRTHNSGDPECNHVNPPSGKRLITCELCGKPYDQDENACRNMVLSAIASSGNGGADEEEVA